MQFISGSIKYFRQFSFINKAFVLSLTIIFLLFFFTSSAYAATSTVTTSADFNNGLFVNTESISKEGELKLKADGLWTARVWKTPYLTLNDGTVMASDGTYTYLIAGRDQRFIKYIPAEDKWRTLAVAPHMPGSGADMVVLGDNIYVIWGQYQKVFSKYTISTDTWTDLTNTPDYIFTGGSIETDGTNLFILRGATTTDFWQYTVASGSWTTLSSTPLTMAAGASLVFDDSTGTDYLYTPRGASTNVFYRYNINANTWTTSTVLPSTINTSGNIAVRNGAIYIMRGTNTATLYRYNISNVDIGATNTWSTLTNTPGNTQYAGLVYNSSEDYFYLFQGNNTLNWWKFDPDAGATGTFIGSADLPNTPGTGADVIYANSNVYYRRGNSSNLFYRYDIALNSWITATTAPATFADDNKGVKAGNYLYFFRGSNTNSFYRYDLSGNSWITAGTSPGGLGVNYGASLAYDGSSDYIYGTRGGLTTAFWRYSISADTWSDTAVADMPTDSENGYGARLVSDGTNMFALTGGGIGRLLKYTVSTNTWEDLGALPFSPYFGTDIVYYNGRFYALSGLYKTSIWEYTIGTDVWRRLGDLPGYYVNEIGAYNGGSIAADTVNGVLYSINGANMSRFLSFAVGTDPYPASGSWTSDTIDLTYVSSWNSLIGTTSVPGGSSISFHTRTSSNKVTWSGWDSVVNNLIGSTAARYIQMKATLTSSGDQSQTPILYGATISYNGDTTPPSNPITFSGLSQQASGTALVSGTENSYKHTNPYFSWSGASDSENSISGYYVYFGVGSTANPETQGTFQTGSNYASTTELSPGTYYLRIKTKDSAGNISDASTGFTYVYAGVSTAANSFSTTAVFTGTTDSVTVSGDQIKLSGRSGFWQQNRLSLMPAGAHYGASFAYISSSNKLYTFRGCNTLNFYEYNIATDTWTALANAPAAVYNGGEIVEGPDGYLYGAPGRSLNTFWRYDISENEWSDEDATDAPSPFNYGSSMVYDNSRYIYVLRGNGDDAFMRYDTLNDSWESLTNVDFGQPSYTPNNNVYLGGDLAFDRENGYIYAIQGNTLLGFSKYDIAANSWTPLDNLPVFPYDGAQIDHDTDTNTLYFYPGYSTPFFYKYDLSSQTWTRLTEAPASIGYGSSIEIVDGVAYILRGLNTQTFWKYEIEDATWKLPNKGLFGIDFRSSDYKTIGTGGNIVKGDGTNYYLARGNFDNQFIRYDASSGTTTAMADAPTGFSTGSALVYDGNDTIYAITSYLVRRFYKYTISTDAWSEVATDPPPVDVNVGASMTYDGSTDYIYFARGNSNGFYYYDTDSGATPGARWVSRANIPAALGTGGEIVYKDGYIYALRGANTLSFYRYDTGANTWSDPLAADLPSGSTMNTDSFLVDGGSAALMACRGGNVTGTSSVSICFNYDIGTTAWSAIANPPANINSGGAAASNGTDRIYMLAGNGTNTFANGIYSYVIPSSSSSYVETGSYISPVHDLTENYKFANVSVVYSAATNADLIVSTRTSSDNSVWGSWVAASQVKQNGTTYTYQVNSQSYRYMQVKFTLTSDGISTGVVDSYSISNFQDLDEPTNPTTINGYLDNSLAVGLTTNNWYSSTAPYFSWPAEDAAGGATDGANGSGLAGYYVYFGIGSTADPVSLGTFTTAPSYQASGLTSGYTYYLRIKTKDNASKVSTDTWAPFIFKSDITPPTNPTTLTVDPPIYSSTTSYTFTWSGSADANSGISQYCYKAGLSGSESCTTQTTVTSIAPYDTGENTFYIRAKDNAGNYATSYAPVTYKHTTTAPGAPENLDVAPTGNTVNEFAFTWDPPLLFSGPQSSLKYYYSVNALPTSQNVLPSIGLEVAYLTASNYATQNGVNTMYVVAKDEAGNIDYNNYASVEFTVNTSAPSAPLEMDIADLSVKDEESWKLAISWEPPTSSGSGIDRYEVYRSTTTGASCTDDFTDFEKVASTSTGNKSFVDVSLGQVTYYYCVKACTSTNVCSDGSETVSLLPDGKWEIAPTLTSEPEASVKTRTATISWVTNRKANSFVKFGKSSGDYGEEVGSSDLITDHEIDLNTLDPGTTYYYKVLWTDEDGNLGESDEYTFTTEAAPFVSSVKFNNISLYEAYVVFTVKNAVEATVEYGKTNAYGSLETTSTSKSESTYTVQLKNLTDGTLYHLRIVAEDNEGNTYNGDDYTFTTLPVPKLVGARIQQVEGMPSATFRLIWSSNTKLTSVVSYYPTSKPALAKDAVNLTPKTGHEIIIKDLLDETEYTIIIKGKDSAGNEAKAETKTVKTAADLRPPEILNANVETTIVGVGEEARAQIIISWDTDEPGTSQVEYGEGTSGQYTSTTQEDGTLAVNHSMTIPGLSPSKIYHFRINSKDKNKNNGTSQDIVVITPNATKDALNLVVNKLSKTFGFLKKASLK